MHTYTCNQDDLHCKECQGHIPRGASFVVVDTPSKRYQENCIDCGTNRVGNEKGARFDETLPGKLSSRKDAGGRSR